jgi:hypothetical protein
MKLTSAPQKIKRLGPIVGDHGVLGKVVSVSRSTPVIMQSSTFA